MGPIEMKRRSYFRSENDLPPSQFFKGKVAKICNRMCKIIFERIFNTSTFFNLPLFLAVVLSYIFCRD